MPTLMTISLAANILILVPIVVLMAMKSWVIDDAWGPFTAARGILFSIYLAILVASIVLVIIPIPAFIAALLLVQVIYKITTPFTVGRLQNPIIISNLVVAALHSVTLVSIFRLYGDQFMPIR